ncbi:hypothetical protein [Oleisolibacter albus]|uniref:hypothetical protein n=1 Tax=Oleisolibacter albus TaxID=2171757 RepID=UPI000DF143BB|nr:hypothetical protein [Oleisolibacter albus]
MSVIRRTVRALALAGQIGLAGTGFCGAAWAASPAAAPATFVPGTEDVPLAPGLTADGEQAVVFDQPSGRIVQATASGSVDAAGIQRFYAETLPQLGWTNAGPSLWTRESERLDISIERQGKRIQVRFSLTPQS